MNEIFAGLQEAFRLIFTLDSDLIEITLRSLQVSVTALLIASALALPLGTWLAIRRFRYRRFAIVVLNALMALLPNFVFFHSPNDFYHTLKFHLWSWQ